MCVDISKVKNSFAEENNNNSKKISRKKISQNNENSQNKEITESKCVHLKSEYILLKKHIYSIFFFKKKKFTKLVMKIH
jgi:hypothetical protein